MALLAVVHQVAAAHLAAAVLAVAVLLKQVALLAVVHQVAAAHLAVVALLVVPAAAALLKQAALQNNLNAKALA